MSFNMRDRTPLDCVRMFNKAMGQALDMPYYKEGVALRMRLIKEEMQEFEEEVNIALSELAAYDTVAPETEEKLLKELCDILYVVYGFAATFGLPLQPAFNRVHNSNMSKLVDGKPVLDEGGKVMKGPNYQKPDLSDLV